MLQHIFENKMNWLRGISHQPHNKLVVCYTLGTHIILSQKLIYGSIKFEKTSSFVNVLEFLMNVVIDFIDVYNSSQSTAMK